MSTRKVAPFIGGLAAGALLFGAVAVGAELTSGELHACANEQTGLVRLVDNGTECRSTEDAVSWNVEGPAGPQGPQGLPGPQGVPGEAGEPGPPGMSNYLLFTRDGDTTGPSITVVTSCGPEQLVLGGGFMFPDGVPPEWRVTQSRPLDATSWVATASGPPVASGVTIRVSATCASVAIGATP